jgi:hypothetical protein
MFGAGRFRVPFRVREDPAVAEPEDAPGDVDTAATWLRTCKPAWAALVRGCGQPCVGDFSMALRVLVTDSGMVFTGEQPPTGPPRHARSNSMANAVVRDAVLALQRRAGAAAAAAVSATSAGPSVISPMVIHGLAQGLVAGTQTHNAGMLSGLIQIARGETPQGLSAPPLVLRLSLRPLSGLHVGTAPDGTPMLEFATTHANALIVFPRCVVVVEPTMRRPLQGVLTWLQCVFGVRVVGVGPSLRCPAEDLQLCTSIAAVVALTIVANVLPQHDPTHTTGAHLQAVCDWTYEHLHWFLRLLVVAYREDREDRENNKTD